MAGRVFYHAEFGDETGSQHFEIGTGVPAEAEDDQGNTQDLVDQLHASNKFAINSLAARLAGEDETADYELIRWWTQDEKGEEIQSSTSLPE